MPRYMYVNRMKRTTHVPRTEPCMCISLRAEERFKHVIFYNGNIYFMDIDSTMVIYILWILITYPLEQIGC